MTTRRVFAVAGACAGVGALLAAGYAAHVMSGINTPEFKRAVLDRARATLGTDVRVREMDISVFEGVALKGVTIGNPSGYRGDLLTAEEFVLRYRLLPLLAGRIEVRRLSMDKPVLDLAMDGRGVFNYERLGGTAPSAGPGGGPSASRAPGWATASPFDLILSRLSVEGARVTMVDQRRSPLLRAEDAEFNSSFKFSAGSAVGTGKASIKTLALADVLYVRSLSAPMTVSKEKLELAPIKGRLAEGDVAGKLALDLKGFRYGLTLDVKGAQVKKLLEEAGSTQSASGRLQAKVSLEGSGGLPTVTGKGQADATDCKIERSAVLVLLAGVLRLPELSSPRFDTCHVEFTLGANRARIPALTFKGPQVQLTGHGVTDLGRSTLDFDMTLALERRILDRIPVREVKSAFHERGDGFSAVDFRVTGTTQEPRTDLTARLAGGTVLELAKGGLGKLFRRRKSN